MNKNSMIIGSGVAMLIGGIGNGNGNELIRQGHPKCSALLKFIFNEAIQTLKCSFQLFKLCN